MNDMSLSGGEWGVRGEQCEEKGIKETTGDYRWYLRDGEMVRWEKSTDRL